MLKLGELGDKIASHPIFLAAFNVTLVALWLMIGTDIANIFISIITAELVLLAAGANRRSFMAIHAKLDEIVKALPEARNEIAHLEDLDEKQIKEKRL